MTHKMTRRQLLQSAGGITFLSLIPVGRGLFAVPASSGAALPIFTALPYIQPGDNSKLVAWQETQTLAWQTQAKPADFHVEYGPTKQYGQSATVTRTERSSGGGDEAEGRFNYAAVLPGLDLGKRHEYKVTCNGQVILAGYFTTRKPRGEKIRFATFGDNSYGDISDRAIAYQAYRALPDFVMNTGDNVYESGLDNEYARYFFPVYNADVAEARTGAPLLRSVPFYTVIANHDVTGRDANRHPAADFTRNPDSLAYYTSMYLPLNGPAAPTHPTPVVGAADAVGVFQSCAGPRFPRMANYSFDYGDAHFCCLDANVYIDPTDTALQQWITQDFTGTDAAWKFVVYHHPAFNVGDEHYAEQHMRVLSPLFEKLGVDFALHGHEHTYQRTMPLRFVPTDAEKASHVGVNDRRVPGTFTVDRHFDGQANVHPDGIIYITTGAGGKHLYDPDENNNPVSWRHPDDGKVDYVTRFISDRHSLTIFDLDAKQATLTQISEQGDVVDRIKVVKA